MITTAVWHIRQCGIGTPPILPGIDMPSMLRKGFLFLLFLLPEFILHAADAPPQHIGTAGSAALKSSTANNLVITTANAVAEGDAIIIAYATDPANDITVTVTDDAGNTYRQSALAINQNNLRTYVFAACNVKALAAAAKITIRQTIPGSTPVSSRAAVAEVFRGLAPSGALEQTNTASGAGAAPSSGTAATVQPVQLLIGAVGTEGPSSDTPGTWSAAFTEGLRAGTNETRNDADITISLGWQVVSSAGNYSATKTGITQRDWAAAIATFKTSDAGISYIGEIGSAQTKASNGTTLTITTREAVRAGDDIVLTIATDAAGTVGSVTDGSGNTYTRVLEAVNNRNVRITVMAAFNVVTLPSAGTINISHASVRARAAVACAFRGLANLNVIDKTQTANGTNRAVSSGATAATIQSRELLIGAVGLEGPNYDVPVTWLNAFTYGPRIGTNFGSGTGGGDADVTAQMGWRIVGSTGTYSAGLNNLVTTRDWAAGIATLKSLDQYTLTVAVDPTAGGTTVPAPGSYPYDENTLVNLTATPAPGYRFDHWTGDVAAPLSANTTVTIHGNVTVTAVFSAQPFITITGPNGGEKWVQGSQHTITWTSTGTSGNVMIEYSVNGGTSWTTLVASTPDDGLFDWIVPAAISKNCLIRISDTDSDPSDVSDAVFTIGRSPVDQRIPLAAGWNLFSLNVTPENTGMTSIVQQQITRSTLVKVQDESGNTIEQNPVDHLWVNNIGNWNPAKGYRIAMVTADTLVVHGAPIEDQVTVNLVAGWNIVGYPLSFSVNATEVLATLMASGVLQKVQDETGYSLEQLTPLSEWINNIGTLDPGEGYQIRVTAPYTFSFTPVFLKNTTENGKIFHDLGTHHFIRAYAGNGLHHMNLYLSFSGETNPLESGDEIGVFDGDRCVGSLVVREVSGNMLALVASADDPSTDAPDGFITGNPIQIRIWRKATGIETVMPAPEVVSGNATFAKQETAWLRLNSAGLPDHAVLTRLGDMYPNPFTERITVTFSLEREALVDISVCSLTGEMIATVTHERFPAGNQEVLWEAVGLPAGTYFCRMTVEGQVFVGKLSRLSPGR